MDEFYALAIVLFVVLAALVAILVKTTQYCKDYDSVHHSRALLSSEYPDLKSGDVIFFVAYVHGFTNSLFVPAFYSHGSVVVEDGDRLLLSEAAAGSSSLDENGYEFTLDDKASLSPLLPRVKHYSGGFFLMSLNKPLDDERKKILLDRARKDLPYPSFSHMVMSLVGLRTQRKARHCMQHVAWLLDELDFIPAYMRKKDKTLLGTGFFKVAGALSSLPGKDLGDGYAYSKPIELIYDIAD